MICYKCTKQHDDKNLHWINYKNTVVVFCKDCYIKHLKKQIEELLGECVIIIKRTDLNFVIKYFENKFI